MKLLSVLLGTCLLAADVQAAGYRQGRRPAEVETRLRKKEIYTGRTAQAVPAKKLSDLPKSFDWCDRNGVSYCTSSWNQHIPQYCGSCYVHGALGAANDRLKIQLQAKHDLLLARQVILNCAPSHGLGAGCDGGEADDIFEYMYRYGLPDESCQNYVAKAADKCTAETICQNCMPVDNPKDPDDISVTRCWAVPRPILYYVTEYGHIRGEEAIMSEIEAGGPVTCGFATTNEFDYHYRGGIFHDTTNATDVNHDVAVVGWGEENGIKYWKVRNSWGTYWGENSFFRIVRGINNAQFEDDCVFARFDTKPVQRVLLHEVTGSMYGLVDPKSEKLIPASSTQLSEHIDTTTATAVLQTDVTKEQMKKAIDALLTKDDPASSQPQSQFPDFAQFAKQGQEFANKFAAGAGQNQNAGAESNNNNGKGGQDDYSQIAKQYMPPAVANMASLAEQPAKDDEEQASTSDASTDTSSSSSSSSSSPSVSTVRHIPAKDSPLSNPGFTSSRHASGVKNSPYEYSSHGEHSRGKQHDPNLSLKDIQDFLKHSKHPQNSQDADDDEQQQDDAKQSKKKPFNTYNLAEHDPNGVVPNVREDDDNNINGEGDEIDSDSQASTENAKWKKLVSQYRDLLKQYADAYKHAYQQGKADTLAKVKDTPSPSPEQEEQDKQASASEAVRSVGKRIRDDIKQFTDEHGLPLIGKPKSKQDTAADDDDDTSSATTTSLNEQSSGTNPSGGFDYQSYLPSSVGKQWADKYGNSGSQFKNKQDEYAAKSTNQQGIVQPGHEYSSRFRNGAGAPSSSSSSSPVHGSSKEEDGTSSASSSSHSSSKSREADEDEHKPSKFDYSKFYNSHKGKDSDKATTHSRSHSNDDNEKKDKDFDFSQFLKGGKGGDAGDFSKYLKDLKHGGDTSDFSKYLQQHSSKSSKGSAQSGESDDDYSKAAAEYSKAADEYTGATNNFKFGKKGSKLGAKEEDEGEQSKGSKNAKFLNEADGDAMSAAAATINANEAVVASTGRTLLGLLALAAVAAALCVFNVRTRPRSGYQSL